VAFARTRRARGAAPELTGMNPLSSVGALLLAIAGGVVYHASAKSIPRDLAPAPVLVAAYATALCLSAFAQLWLPAPRAAVWAVAHPAVFGLGLGAAMIELGYVLTYRAAWPVSVASVLVNGVVAALLVPLGIGLFGERLSATRVAGMLLCLVGVWLLRR
jgi:drug/metabolite transporter (DMT)-like permease